MTHRRRRRRRGIPSGAAKGIAVLIGLGVCLYAALATSAGNFMAERVIAPLLGLLQSAAPSPTPEPETEQETFVPQYTPQSAASEDITLEGFTLYALQFGVFASEQNALGAAKELKDRGAGGYVRNEEGAYRVLGAVYSAQDEARKVKDALLEKNGVEAAVFTLEAPEVTVRITAGEKGLSAVKAAFEGVKSAKDGLLELSGGVDGGSVNAGDAHRRLSELAAALSECAKGLEGEAGVEEIRGMVQSAAGSLAECAAAQPEGAALSAGVKHALIELLCDYCDIIKTLA